MSGLLILADGTRFEGTSVGAEGIAVGEAVFNTTMSGYQEVFTDPSYAGQVVVMTSPHIGNYGVASADEQAAAPHCAGIVVRSISQAPSSWRAEDDLPSYLRSHGLVSLTGIDTRRLTRHLRANGAMPMAMGPAHVAAEVAAAAATAPPMEGSNLVDRVTTTEPYAVVPSGTPLGSVVAIDLGIKRDIIAQLTARGLAVTVVPATTSAEEILAMKPDGVFLSNGPGDPEPLVTTIATVRGLLGAVPVFGICLGHQLLGLAMGARTYKLPFGHHGGNHPVKNLETGRVAITAQNHGFAVDLWSLAPGEPPSRTGVPGPDLLPARVGTKFGAVAATHQNLNDGTLEGMAFLDVPAFGVQFHPEAAPGPHDAVGLFDRFLDLMDGA
ncbi:MAG: glutamine-hydrolyzing carbamoyl-phosphate synthase small subunit [Acidimicrobiia bacterium]|nr:glutamine-hydrolyzing carbamoyl-phosphate synthase small subunit [Acidimicrobiia bacterium]NNL69869.1 glutamine-hydrolyzing carbamoyl-phosphate synthase small subunit [Acidimicrobiia bacterium]